MRGREDGEGWRKWRVSVGSGVVGTADCEFSGPERSLRDFSVATRGKNQVSHDLCLFEGPYCLVVSPIVEIVTFGIFRVFIAEIFAPSVFTH